MDKSILLIFSIISDEDVLATEMFGIVIAEGEVIGIGGIIVDVDGIAIPEIKVVFFSFVAGLTGEDFILGIRILGVPSLLFDEGRLGGLAITDNFFPSSEIGGKDNEGRGGKDKDGSAGKVCNTGSLFNDLGIFFWKAASGSNKLAILTPS